MNRASKTKRRTAGIWAPIRVLFPVLLIGFFPLLFIVLCLLDGPKSVSLPIMLCVLIFIFLCVVISVILLHLRFRRSGKYLTTLLQDYDIIGPEETYSMAEFLTSSGRRQIMRTAQDHKGRIDQLQFLRNQAEYTAHQSQINPHFLYNTLDTIRGKALEYAQDDVADMIESLSRIFRYSINNKSDMFSLQDELRNVKDYVKIQQIRFANRFAFHYEVDEEDWRLLYFRVPKLILQPLVENAILHGLESMVSGGEVTLSAYRTEKLVILRVADNGHGMSVENIKALSAGLRQGSPPPSAAEHGIALMNINQRIKYIFGQEYGITLSSSAGYGTTVEIIMPYTEV